MDKEASYRSNNTPFHNDKFPIVGIGASTGGIRAFKVLLQAIPEKSGMAYILVLHLHPRNSSLADILQKVTQLPVLLLSDKGEGEGEGEVKKNNDGRKEARIRQLEKELVQLRKDMVRLTEELESTSKDLQDFIEESESSKEELQSTNEEIIVLNHEMFNLNEQIATEKSYSEAIVETIHDPLFILDKILRVKRQTMLFMTFSR